VPKWEDKSVVDSSGKKVKRKQATLKTRKFIGTGHGKRIGGASDSEGDNDEISFGDERPPPPKKRTLAPAAAATVPAKKQPLKAESCSDVDMIDDAQPRPPPKQKNSTLGTKDPDSDSGDDLVRAALEKGKGKATQSQTSKRKS
jgi:DNA topoisomerase-2